MLLTLALHDGDRVFQHNRRYVARGMRGMNRVTEALSHELRDEPDVILMRMRDDERIYRADVIRERRLIVRVA